MALLNWLRDKVQIARALSLGDWFILVEAWWGLLFFYIAIRRVSFERLNQMSQIVTKTQGKDIFEKARHMQGLVHLASRLHPLAMTCLPRALALRWMLRRRGIPARVQIGVTKTAHGFQAHAWLEVEGQQVGEAEEVTERFQTFSFTRT